MNSKMSLISFVEYWLENYKRNTIKPATFNRLLISINGLKNFKISEQPIEEINLFSLQSYVNELVRTGYSISTIKKQTQIVTAPLKVAASMRLIPTDPTFGVKIPAKTAVKKKTRKVSAYNMEEQKKLLAVLATRERSSYPAIELFLELGIRPGEMLALKWDDVDLDHRRIHIHATIVSPERATRSFYQNSPKSDSSNRIIPLTEKAIVLLRELQEKGTTEWVNDYAGHRLTYQSLTRHAKYACEMAGIEYRGLHALRHTFATNCYHKGMDIKVLSKILGHAKVDITYNIYIDLYGDGFDEMYKAMSAV